MLAGDSQPPFHALGHRRAIRRRGRVGAGFELGHAAPVTLAFHRDKSDGATVAAFDRQDCGLAEITGVGQGVAHRPDDRADVRHHRRELPLVVGLVADVLPDDEHRGDIHGGLGVVTLFEAAAVFHDPAFGVGEVVLILGPRPFLWRLGGFAAELPAGAFFLGFAGGELCLVFRLFFQQPFLGPCFHAFHGFAELGDAVLAALDFLGNGQPVLQRGAVGALGFGQQFGDLLAGQLHLLDRVAVAHRAVFAGIGQNLGAVDGHGEVAHLQHAGPRREFEHLVEGGTQQVLVLAPELTDRIVVRVGVGAEVAHGDVLISERFDAAAGEGARGITVDQEAEHHGGGLLGAAGAALVDPRQAQVQRHHRAHDEVDHVVRRHPVAQIGRQEHRSGVVNVDEADGHAACTRRSSSLVQAIFHFNTTRMAKSDRLLAVLRGYGGLWADASG